MSLLVINVAGIKDSTRNQGCIWIFLGFGITVMFGLQAIINIAVVSGIVPTKGIPLPFVSSGGSSLLFSMIGIGILINIAKQSLESVALNPQLNREPSEDKVARLLPARIWHNMTSKIASFSWR